MNTADCEVIDLCALPDFRLSTLRGFKAMTLAEIDGGRLAITFVIEVDQDLSDWLVEVSYRLFGPHNLDQTFRAHVVRPIVGGYQIEAEIKHLKFKTEEVSLVISTEELSRTLPNLEPTAQAMKRRVIDVEPAPKISAPMIVPEETDLNVHVLREDPVAKLQTVYGYEYVRFHPQTKQRMLVEIMVKTRMLDFSDWARGNLHICVEQEGTRLIGVVSGTERVPGVGWIVTALIREPVAAASDEHVSLGVYLEDGVFISAPLLPTP